MGVETADEQIMQDAFWESHLEHWEQEVKFDTEYVAMLDNKVVGW